MLKDDKTFPIAAAAERQLDRRRFLGLAGCATLMVAAGEWLGARFEASRPKTLEVTVRNSPSLPLNEAQPAFAADGRAALVVRLTEDEVVAFERRCPHLGCPVLWSAERERFECPCHRAAFDARTGRVLFGPPRRGLTRATVRSV